MNPRLPVVLVCERDLHTREALQQMLAGEAQAHLVVVEDEREALAHAERERPEVVIVGRPATGGDALALVRRLRTVEHGAGRCLLLVDADATDELKGAALMLGVSDFLARPLARAEVVARVHGLLRLAAAEAAQAAARTEAERLQREGERRQEQLIELLTGLMDLALPGSADRGRAAAELALKLAARFEVPAEFHRDLDLAARLHELGRLVHTGDARADATAPPAPGEWQYAHSARTILARVDGLLGASELLGALFENWDGTGLPDRVQAGQIPLRSRLLRVVVDLQSHLHYTPGATRADVLEQMRDHAGTLYDPKALVHLAAVCAGGDQAESRTVVVPIERLRPGMRLAEDLCTDAGLKLLAADTVISLAVLETIQRRHRMEPILQGARVLRKAA